MHARGLGQLIDGDLIFFHPLRVRLPRRELLLDLFVGNDAAFDGIDQEHLSRLQAAFALDLLGRDVEHAGFRGHHDQIVMGDDVASGAQAVAVERRADDAAVGEGDRSGAVPRLHQAGVIFVEGALLRLHVRIARPGFGNQHGHDVRQAASGLEEQLDGVVEVRGVAAVGRDDGMQFLHVVAEQRRLQQRLAGLHPVDVAAERVDLAVVRDVAIRMRALPTGKRIGREALVHQAQRADRIGIGKFAVEVRDLRGEQQAFVDDGAAGKRRDVEHLRVFNAGLADFIFCALAHDVEFALEGVFVHAWSAAHENLLDVGLRSARHAADRGGIDRRIPPAEQGQAFFANDALENSFALQALVLLDRQERHADAVGSGLRQREAEFLAFAGKELVRNLDEHAGAVAGFRIAAAGAAMRQVEQNLNSLADDVVTFLAADAGDKPDAAGVVLVRRVVETLGGRQAVPRV